MRAMTKLASVLGIVWALGACGGGGVEGELKKWRDRMCDCKDVACVEKTMDEYNAWGKSKRDEAKKMSEGELETLKGIEKELKACRRKIKDAAGGDKPTEPTPAPAPATP
jgi:hypothetical protein